VLRKMDGLVFDDEPAVWRDELGEFVRCPKCSQRVAWPSDMTPP
jgi:hypothetical protein